MQLAYQAGVPVVTRGAGSGLAGGATPTAGALLLALTHMQRLSVDSAQQVAHAEAGVVTADVQQAAAAHGLLYAPDPSSQGVSTIGGNIACNAGGPRCLKYGVTANYVSGLTAVLADGTVLCLGDGLTAQTPDAGLLHLLTGSEGTLAVVTEATLQLIHCPAARRTALALFERLDDACATVEAIMASGLLPAALELMDDTCIRVVEDAMSLGLPRDAGALLLLLSDGEPEAVEEEAARLADLARQGGARSVQVAQNASEEAGLWRARRSVSPAFARVHPNKLGEDICVPLPQIAHTVRRIKDIAARYDLPIPVFGHAGDGNLHPNVLFDRRDPAQVERVWQAAEEIFAVALEAGGTLSGEHGIGMLKRSFMAAALGEDVLALQRAIKARFDPRGLLNPGKVL
jgi:glycolate oxidase subunit GlcD